MQILKPTPIAISEDQISAIIEAVEATGKRSGGGTAQVGSKTFSELASSTIPCQNGFDKRKNQKWNSPEEALRSKFEEYRWTPFETAIVIAVVKRFSVDPQDGYIPLAQGKWDIEAAFDPDEIYEHREIVVHGQLREDSISPSLPSYGISSEFGNLGDSAEITLFGWTDGNWEKIIDTQQGRETATVIVGPHITLLCEGEKMSINSLRELLPSEITVKTRTAIEMAENVCRELK